MDWFSALVSLDIPWPLEGVAVSKSGMLDLEEIWSLWETGHGMSWSDGSCQWDIYAVCYIYIYINVMCVCVHRCLFIYIYMFPTVYFREKKTGFQEPSSNVFF